MDLLIFSFLALAGISAAFLGVFSYLGYWQNKETWAIWSFYCVIVFTTTAGFLSWQKRIWEKLPSERPRMVVERAEARPLVAGQKRAVSLWLRNRGTKAAHNITVSINQAFAKSDFGGPLKFTFIEPESRPDCEPGAIVTLVGESSAAITAFEIKALNEKTANWFHFGKGVYQDELNNTYPLDFFCFMYEPSIEGYMRICPDRYWPSKVDSTRLGIQARPEVLMEAAEARCEVGKPPEVIMRVKNWGQITAHKVELESTHYFAHARTFKGPMEHVPNAPPYVYPRLPPNAEAEARTEGGPAFTAQDVTDIKEGKLLWLNYSKGKYEDEAGNRYPFDFCVLYKPGRPLMDIAPKAYWPKDSHG